MTEDTPYDDTDSIHLNSDAVEVARSHAGRPYPNVEAPSQIGPYKILSELAAGWSGRDSEIKPSRNLRQLAPV